MKDFNDFILVEMALERSKAVRKIVSQVPNFEDNFVKLMLMPKHTAEKHWKVEVEASIGICKRIKLKGSNKRFSVDEFLSIVEENIDLKSAIDDVVEDYKIKNPVTSKIDVVQFTKWLRDCYEANSI